MSIFVSIASYRDPEIVKTLQSAVDNARYPNDLHFSVLTQEGKNDHPDLYGFPNMNHQKMHFKDSMGAGYARKILMETYNDQEYFFQTDSHMRFAPNWDVRMITMLEQCQEENNEKVILSQFPAPYQVFTDGRDYFPQGDKSYWSEPSWTSVVRTSRDEWAGNREEMKDKSKPHKSHTVLAGYIFASGKLPEEVPYDERISFMGEELCFAVRAYTRGWEIYAPNEMLLWHFYSRRGYSKVWNQRDDVARKMKWKEIESNSREIQKNILTGKETGIYGIGDKRRFAGYQKMVGINFEKFYEDRDGLP
jgi:hypothetical protein